MPRYADPQSLGELYKRDWPNILAKKAWTVLTIVHENVLICTSSANPAGHNGRCCLSKGHVGEHLTMHGAYLLDVETLMVDSTLGPQAAMPYILPVYFTVDDQGEVTKRRPDGVYLFRRCDEEYWKAAGISPSPEYYVY